MAVRLRTSLMSALGDVRYEPTAKRIRAVLGGVTVIDTTRAVMVWEPRRVVSSFAVPIDDLDAELVPTAQSTAPASDDMGHRMPDLSRRPVLDPSIPFGVHTADGEVVDVQSNGQSWPGAGFRLTDADLPGYVVLDFAAFDSWLEEDQPNVSHPRDPYHRIDVLPSSRHVRLEFDGEVLAESSRPMLLFEAMLPTRYYLPRDDVRIELTPSDTRTTCAYKGHASYWSGRVGDQVIPDIAWSYEEPLDDALKVRGLVAFFDERLDVVLDGERLERPVTPWSKPPGS